jgi:hypothetical protein
MTKGSFKTDPGRAPRQSHPGHRKSGLFVAGLAVAILIIVGVVWAAQSYTTSAPWSIASSSSASETTGQGQ